ncbi:expressed unknown protein [Seminavis robusta]|uniref:Right handed beta helix domain-containing protein n=1 Tax=Seminavis robusta TaxID=568900 RepID=A0A9N8HFD9_9STRA|nr:expressed unknown protein [Seminavis robusta]|eukprot:Sro345_g122510.1 n/a (518) ;mRNA; r:53079-54885
MGSGFAIRRLLAPLLLVGIFMMAMVSGQEVSAGGSVPARPGSAPAPAPEPANATASPSTEAPGTSQATATNGDTEGADEDEDVLEFVEDELNMTMGDFNMTMDDFNMTNMTAPTEAPTIPTLPPTSEDGCYTTLDAVYYVISDDDKLFQQKRFVMCPDSVFDVGFLVPGIGIDKGQAPIVPRSNTELLCGEDGKSTNNCIIRGGDFGLIVVPVFFRQDLAVNNVVIKGFTFVGQVQYAAFVASSGDIRFEDCVFRDSANFGTFVMNFDSTLDLSRRLDEDTFKNPWDHVLDYVERYRSGRLPRRLAAEVEDVDLAPQDGVSEYQEERNLQADVFRSLIKDCRFENLQQVERKLGVEFGIFTVKGPDHDIVMEDCTFANNQFGNQELTPIGYAILIQGAKIKLDGLCFVDNDFRGNGVVLLEQTPDPWLGGTDVMDGVYVTEDDDDLDCPFGAWFETDADRRNATFYCVNPTADECGGEHIDIGPRPPLFAPPTESASAGLWSHFALFLGLSCAALLL